MDDPYKVLGVARDATADEIRRAYRKLAKAHHPDLNPGNAKAEDSFKAASAANEILSDPVKRGQFDRVNSMPAAKSKPGHRLTSNTQRATPAADIVREGRPPPTGATTI